MNRIFRHIVLFIIIIANSYCGMYNYIISSLPKEVKTFALHKFISKSPKNESFTIINSIKTNLRNKLLSIKLNEVDEKSDIQFIGELLEYRLNRMGDFFEILVNMQFVYKDYQNKEIKIPIVKRKKLSKGIDTMTKSILNEIITESVNEILQNSVSKWEI